MGVSSRRSDLTSDTFQRHLLDVTCAGLSLQEMTELLVVESSSSCTQQAVIVTKMALCD